MAQLRYAIDYYIGIYIGISAVFRVMYEMSHFIHKTVLPETGTHFLCRGVDKK